MNFNPAVLMKIMSAKNTFDANHPKLKNYFSAVKEKGIREDTVIQLKITNPNDEPMIANIKVKQSDLDLIQELGELIK
ncbi:MAG: hypothetical protein NC397_10225 [Clostridium sp.]|nr:hypothetical protein [Clostridium sp.]